MARKKVKLMWIQSDSARRATLKKRRQGLMKKVRELGILCDIPTCCVIYGPYDTAPETWPPENPALVAIIRRYLSTPEVEKSKKLLNQEGFLRAQIVKFKELLKKIKRENEEAELITLLHECIGGKSVDDFSREETTSLANMLDKRMQVLRDKIRSMRNPMSLINHPMDFVGAAGSSSSGGGPTLDEMNFLMSQNNNIYPQPVQSNVNANDLLPTAYTHLDNQSWMNYFFQSQN